MRVMTSDGAGRWTRGIGIAAVVGLAWAVYAPGGAFWTAAVAAGVIGAAVATWVLVRSRSMPSLAQVIVSAEAEGEPAGAPARAGYGHGAGSRPRGEQEP